MCKCWICTDLSKAPLSRKRTKCVLYGCKNSHAYTLATVKKGHFELRSVSKMTLLNFLGVGGKAFLVVCCRFNLRVKSPRFRSQFCYPPIEADQNMGFLGCSSVRHLLTSLEIIAVIFNVGGGRAIPVLLSWKHEQRNFKNALFVFCYCWAPWCQLVKDY